MMDLPAGHFIHLHDERGVIVCNPANADLGPNFWFHGERVLFSLAIAGALNGPAPEPVEAPEIRYLAPQACPDRGDLLETLELFTLETSSGAGLVGIEFIIEAPPEGRKRYTGTLTLETIDGSTTHDLESPNCATVVRAGTLLIAVAIDPVDAVEAMDASSRQPATSVAADGRDATATEVRSAPPARQIFDDERPPAATLFTEVEPEPRTPRIPGFRDALVSAAAGGGIGPMPGGAGSVSGTLGFRFRRARIELSGVHWFAKAYEHPDGSGAGADVSVSMARILGCWEPHVRDTLSFPVCAGMDAGGAVGRGFGPLSRSSREVAPWLAATATASVWWRIAGPVALTLAADGSVGLTRPIFDIAGKPAPVVESNRGAFRAILGLGAHFP